MFGKLFASLLPRVKADDEELVDPQTVLRVSFVSLFFLPGSRILGSSVCFSRSYLIEYVLVQPVFEYSKLFVV